MNVTIKGVKENIYRIFKAEAIKKGKTLREAINEAMDRFGDFLENATPA